jgi:hypothetical protein
MRKIKIIVYALTLMFVATHCTDIENQETLHPDKVGEMTFIVNGEEKTFAVKFVYNRQEGRYVLQSDEIEEHRMKHAVTGEILYAYYPKDKATNAKVPPGGGGGGGPVPEEPYEIRKGYVGYSPSTGCWYFGTLYVDNEGDEIFVPANEETQLMNPPLCGYWYA